MNHPFTLRDGRALQLTKHPRHTHADAATLAAAPWGIRITAPNGKRGWQSLRTADTKDALRRAKDLLEVAAAGPGAWTTHAEINQRRAGLVVHTLVAEYLAAGCPRIQGRTLTPRTGRSLDDERRNLETALRWWSDRALTAIGPRLIDDYAAHRATAPRAAELELNALSNALKYAVRRERISANPLAGRGAIRPAASIVHCHQEAPASTDELHALCRRLLLDPLTAPYGAQLIFQALTGLRPGEPGHLRWDAQPGQPGSRSTLTADGATFEVLHIHREKHGINPAVRVHPALDDFLRAWRQYLTLIPRSERSAPGCRQSESTLENLTPAELPQIGAREDLRGISYYFPHPRNPELPCVPAGNAQGSYLDKALKRAAAALGIKANRRPHAMRAFYVRVRRSLGALDSTIASELGERTGERLIVSTYGDPAGLRGDGKFTWLPATGQPCWSHLVPEAPANIIPMPAPLDTKLDTTTGTQTTPSHRTPTHHQPGNEASST